MGYDTGAGIIGGGVKKIDLGRATGVGGISTCATDSGGVPESGTSDSGGRGLETGTSDSSGVRDVNVGVASSRATGL